MKDGRFLQSESWADFQKQIGHTTYRVDNILVVEHLTPVGKYWYIARTVLNTKQTDEIVQAAKESGVVFIRIDPVEELQLTTYNLQLTKPTQPQTTLVLDITPSSDALLQSFHEKTRYNIRLAERKGVMIEESTDPTHQNFAAFIALSKQMGSRQGIRLHGNEYYRQMLETVQSKELSTSIVAAYHGDQPLAANLMLWAGDTAYYLHGASDHSARQLMAPPLLQWACIQRAKTRGIAAYDFWGVAPATGKLLVVNGKLSEPPPSPNDNSQLTTHNYQYDESHPWAGITRFKLGFGGKVVRYPDSINLVLDPFRYRVYQVGRMLRRTLGRVV